MTQISILNGIYVDGSPEYRTRLPRNYVPVPKVQGISAGYLRPADGITTFAVGPGIDRGGINWNGELYRVMGTKFVRVSSAGVVTTLGDVGGSGQVTMDYSFDQLAIVSGGKLFYWDGNALIQVVDPDLGVANDVIWVDGYFMTTDGTFLVVTELNAPTQINPLKYGSSEADPDPIKAVLKLRNEPVALNRYTSESFENIGGETFPFQRIEGAQVMRGTVGTHTACIFMEAVAFVGSGRNEPPAVWIASNGSSTKLSTDEIDLVLRGYSEAILANGLLEVVVDRNAETLYFHLPDRTLCYDFVASQALEQPVWYQLDSGTTNASMYRARDFVWCYDRWVTGDPLSTQLGTTTRNLSSHFGSSVGWDFNTQIVYNNSRGAQIHELELAALPGYAAAGADPMIFTSASSDGVTFTPERGVSAGKLGEQNKRIVWRRLGHMHAYRIQRFRGDSGSHLPIARLEAQIEALNA